MKKFIYLILVCLVVISGLSACKGEKETPAEYSSSAETKEETASSSAQTKGKYEDAEVYKNENGVEAAKTQKGEEVELTGENMQKLYEEYEKVRGTGSEKEKELLDKMQVILDITNK